MTNSFIIDPALPVRPAMLDGMQREWDRLAAAGTWWTGADRVALAAEARAAADHRPSPASVLAPEITAMARRIATTPHVIDRTSVDALHDQKVSLEAYTEMVGVIARLTAVDTAVRGMGSSPAPLPKPQEGVPTYAVVPDAKRRSAHVAMVGSAGATSALSSVAAEDSAQQDLHGALYLSYSEMGDYRIVKDIPRWQMELAAATTSWLNHCVY
ncbi:MAG: hypothetical protein R8J94_19540 [Acidimicrobiia bacterium]|nr:hypothetical protein [Acidimicrobiia bacterium]